jgi:hypothetical protein
MGGHEVGDHLRAGMGCNRHGGVKITDLAAL